MKKLVSLVMVLALVLCLATAAFADDTPAGSSYDNPIVVEDANAWTSVDATAGTMVWYKLPASCAGKVLAINAMGAPLAIYGWNEMFGGEQELSSGFGNASAYLTEGKNGVVVGIVSMYYDTAISISFQEPVEGSEYKPAVITDLSKPISVNCLEGQWGPEYHMTYTAGEVGGELTISNVTGNFFQINMNTDSAWGGYFTDSTSASIGLYAGQTVDIVVVGNDLEPITFDCAFTAHEKGASEFNPIIIEDKDKDYTFEVTLNEDGSPVFFALSDVNGAILTINDAHAFIYTQGYTGCTNIDDGDDDVLTVQLEVYGESNVANICVGSGSATDTKYTVTVSEPEGYDENPEIVKDIDKLEAEIPGGMADHYFYQWVANETGKVTLSLVDGEWTEDYLYAAATEWKDVWNEVWQDYESVPSAWYDVNVQLSVMINGKEVVAGKNEVVFDVAEKDVVTVKVSTLPCTEYDEFGYGAVVEIAGKLDALGSKNNPIVINNASELAGIDVAGKGETYIAVNSMLNGQIVTIIGDDNTTVTYGTTEVKADNGVFAVELTGVPTNMIIVGNKGEKDASYIASINYPLGSANNPIVVNNASELGGIDVAGKGETYIAVSSQLNGQILTIVGNSNTTVNVNGTAVTAVDGVFTVELTGVPTNKIVVGNKGDKDASYVAGISYPAGSESNPTVVNPAAGAVKAEAAAGSTTYYVINGSYNGNYVVITGEGLTVTVNGTAVKGSNGKYVVELTGTPVNSIVIANSGTAAVAYSIVTSDNPPTGDAGILMPVAAALVSVMGAAMLVMKKKEN